VVHAAPPNSITPIAISISRIALVNSETGWPKKDSRILSLFVIIVNDTLPETTTYGMCVRTQTLLSELLYD
jgi:hypothetical protein